MLLLTDNPKIISCMAMLFSGSINNGRVINEISVYLENFQCFELLIYFKSKNYNSAFCDISLILDDCEYKI
jgi:hypothetical protein